MDLKSIRYMVENEGNLESLSSFFYVLKNLAHVPNISVNSEKMYFFSKVVAKIFLKNFAFFVQNTK